MKHVEASLYNLLCTTQTLLTNYVRLREIWPSIDAHFEVAFFFLLGNPKKRKQINKFHLYQIITEFKLQILVSTLYVFNYGILKWSVYYT